MKIIVALSVLSVLVLQTGCTKERVYENIYNGLNKREEIVNPSGEPIPSEQPSYSEYKRDRQKTLGKDSEETK